jgi:hypothetical protein
MDGQADCLFFPALTQVGEKDHFPEVVITCQQHGQPVDAHAESTGGRHAVSHGFQVIFIHGMALFVVIIITSTHFNEALLLIEWVIQF